MKSTEITKLKTIATTTLQELVTSEGVFASSAKGAIHGRFHGLFGRDTLYTVAFILETETLLGKTIFLDNAIKSVRKLAQWQGVKDDPITHEQPGKIPHEVRENPEDYEHMINGRIKRGLLPYYLDPLDPVLKNWYSNESTPLWIIIVSQLINTKHLKRDTTINEQLKKALKWCMQNIGENDGFAGYAKNVKNPWYENGNQSWKDGKQSYLLPTGVPPKHPIKDVGVNAIMWAALRHGVILFADQDEHFSLELANCAADMKIRFNTEDKGFLMPDHRTKWYFAEALDGDNKQLRDVCIDPGLALWATVEGECIIDNKYLPLVIKRLMEPDMFNPEAGIGIYSSEGTTFDPIAYHRGPHTYWPFMSGLVGWGMQKQLHPKEAKQVLTAMLKGIQKFNSCIELFLKKNDEYVLFVKPETGAMSSTDQAWTAGAIYYATTYLKTTKH